MVEEKSEIEKLKADNGKPKGEIAEQKHRVANPYPPFKPEEHEGSEYLGGGMWRKKKFD